MIDELRIYTLAAGAMPAYLDAAEHVAVPVRGDRHGRLVGFWTGVVGAVNRVFNLWRHDGLDARQRVRAELDALDGWRNDYLPRVRPLMLDQTIRLMDAVIAPEPPTTYALYEVRFYRARPGHARRLAAAIADEASRAPDGTIGLWTLIAPDPNEVVQLCGFSSVEQRFPRGLSSVSDMLVQHGTSIDRVESSIVVPANHSPMR